MRTDCKALCIVTGGIGDEILALPAVRYLCDAVEAGGIDLRLGGWRGRRRLYGELLARRVRVRPLEALWRCTREHVRTYDWIVNFDTREPALDSPLPPSVKCRLRYISFGRNFPLHDRPGSPFWERCLAMARSVAGSESECAAAQIVQPSEVPRNGRFRLAVSPGGYSPPFKKWPPESFAQVIRSALSLDADVFLLGSERERQLAEHIKALVGEPVAGRLFIAAGGLALEQLPHLLRSIDLHLTNDNGAAHVGGAVNAKQIVLYRGVTSKHRTIGHRDIALFSGDEATMSGIRSDDVIRLVMQHVAA